LGGLIPALNVRSLTSPPRQPGTRNPCPRKPAGFVHLKFLLMPISSFTATRLEHQHRTIRELAGGLPEAELRRPVNPGKWSAFEQIAHLAAYQPIFADRLKKIAGEPAPVFDRYVAENDPHFTACLQRSPVALFDDIDSGRAAILSALEAGGETLLSKTGLHTRYGLLTGKEWIEFFLLHEAHHLFVLFQLVQDLRINCDKKLPAIE
jgi:DinB superfamily